MDPMMDNRKAPKMPQKNSFKFIIRDDTRISGGKSRQVIFSSEFDSGNCEEVKKIEDFKVPPPYFI